MENETEKYMNCTVSNRRGGSRTQFEEALWCCFLCTDKRALHGLIAIESCNIFFYFAVLSMMVYIIFMAISLVPTDGYGFWKFSRAMYLAWE